jgi:hypothetical protein
MINTFTVRCSYCNGTHDAIAGTYYDGAPYNGRTVYGVQCAETGTSYGLLAETDRRI